MARSLGCGRLAVLLPLLAACEDEAGVRHAMEREPGPIPDRTTVVLITLDTTRADHLSTYGYERATDPFLAALAAESRVFTQAVASSTWTLPSHVSLFSGLDPAEHGCWMHAGTGPDETIYPRVPDSVPLFTRQLRDAGYYLVGAVGGFLTSRKYGFDRDFDRYFDPGQAAELSGVRLNAFVQVALDDKPEDRPLFLFVNYFDAHAPYGPPADRDYPFGEDGLPEIFPHETEPGPDRIRNIVDQYDRELLIQDEALAQLWHELEGRGLLRNAIVVITSDHGEFLGENGYFEHTTLPYRPLTHVPLLVHVAPGGPRDRIDRVVSIASIPETLLAFLELPPMPVASAGRRVNLLELPPGVVPAYTEFKNPWEWVGAVQDDRHKYALGLGGGTLAPLEFFEASDWQLSQWERGSEAPVPPEVAERLKPELISLMNRWRAAPEDLTFPDLAAEDLEHLRALGY